MWKAQELGYKVGQPITVLVDNAAGISFQQKMNPDSKLKGIIDLRWNWVRKLQDNEQVKAVNVDTTNNAVNVLTCTYQMFEQNHV